MYSLSLVYLAKLLAVTSAFARTTAEEINTVDIFVVSFYLEKLFCEVCMLYACQTPLALHSTLQIVGHTVVHRDIFRFCCHSGARSEMEMCL